MKNRLILSTALICLTLTSCIKEKLEVMYNQQEEKINSYIESALNKNPEYEVTNNGGSNRLTTLHGEGEGLEADGSISFYYAGYVFNGRISPDMMFSTNHQASADDAAWDLTDADYQILTINLKEEELLPGLKNGLLGVKGGEECEIIFSGKYGFGNKPYGIIPANSALIYKIWVISISND